jgi:hypothetical protein
MARRERPVVKTKLILFVVPPATDKGASPPGPPSERTIEARTDDGLLEVAREQLAAEGYRLRSLSFGPTGLVAYVEERR